MNSRLNGSSLSLQSVRDVLEQDGRHAVLLPIEEREKRPFRKGWPKVTYADTQEVSYQRQLSKYPNTGVLLGAPSDDLCAIDFDTEAGLKAFLVSNPQFEDTLTTRGERAGQLWAYISGQRPRQVHPLRVRKDSPLAVGCKKEPDKDGKVTIGEFRAEGGQSVIRGVHPCGCDYTCRVETPPITIPFDLICWPLDIATPWEEERKNFPGAGADSKDNQLIKRAVAALTVEALWKLFGLPERKTNPTESPFRTDNTPGHPSFSIYNEGRRFKDHNSAYSDHRGDSFDFYQRWHDQDPRQAFKGFVELAGLGNELTGRSSRRSGKPMGKATKSAPASVALTPELVASTLEGLSTYYDSTKASYWVQNNRGGWIKVIHQDVTRRLKIQGFDGAQTDTLLVAIQKQNDVDYAGSLAGYHSGIYLINGKRILVRDSPTLLKPVPGEYPLLEEIVLRMLGVRQLTYLYGWLKVALESLYYQDPGGRQGQALVLAGPADCGKSLLQNLITVLLGGRSAKPYRYMTEGTQFNSELIGCEHLTIEDEVASKDIRTRRKFGAEIKKICANENQSAHAKGRDAITVSPFQRLSVSVNDEPDYLLVLPPLDESLADKLIILKAAKHPMPRPTASPTERSAFWNELLPELPHFIDYLFHWQIPEALKSQRYGITHFQHPDVLQAIGAMTREAHLLGLIDEPETGIFSQLAPAQWKGSAEALARKLKDGSKAANREAERLLYYPEACGALLAKLAKVHPGRFQVKHLETGNVWTIEPPESDA